MSFSLINGISLLKKILIFFVLFSLLLIFLGFINYLKPLEKLKIKNSLYDEVKILKIDGEIFRDLNKNNSLDIYEDHRLDSKLRSDDLLNKMTIEEKVGQMFHPPFTLKPDIWMLIYEIAIRGNKSTEAQILFDNISHFNLYGNPSPAELANKINHFQEIASRSRLGVPITISSDPIHEVPKGGGVASFSVDGFSKWPSQLGFAATNDALIIKNFAQIVKEEYLAVGIRTALHPMSDLATDPRWARNFGTFGSNALLSSDMTIAYMNGFQGNTISSESVLTMVKHFPGGGPQQKGLDPHLYSGRNQTYPGNNFDYHLIPFKDAINNNLKVIMPYYGIPIGQTNEDVAMAYNEYILTDLLREELGFRGVICSDWGIITGRHWGVDELSIADRYEKSINAGIDQYGGETETSYLIKLIKENIISEERINESVKRILVNKFELGLFDEPYVDENKINDRVNTKKNIEAGLEAQRKSIVLLENNGALPLKKGMKIFVDGLDNNIAKDFGVLVKDPSDADVIIMYIHTVFNGNQESGLNRVFDNFLSTLFPNGELNFNSEIHTRVENYSKDKELIVVVDLNRPAILEDIKKLSSSLIGTFGVSDQIMFEGIFGEFSPTGKLPFEIPSSMESVLNQKEDVPDDSLNPTYEMGYGISY
ncbi:glycoside hydrolase family 3 N-terminal domain-containing protein [Gammaproteobacteria bacterium]|nr:glycoside hydrolase family 3 N-terminal domain-containing protein [Gammaproteobacteria bacterium]